MYSLLQYVGLGYLVVGFFVWALVIYVPRKQPSVAFAVKSGVLLMLFWPPFVYVSGRRIFRGKYKEQPSEERTPEK